MAHHGPLKLSPDNKSATSNPDTTTQMDRLRNKCCDARSRRGGPFGASAAMATAVVMLGLVTGVPRANAFLSSPACAARGAATWGHGKDSRSELSGCRRKLSGVHTRMSSEERELSCRTMEFCLLGVCLFWLCGCHVVYFTVPNVVCLACVFFMLLNGAV